MEKIELKDLVGQHNLTAVRVETQAETPEHYTRCRFVLDGRTYEAREDPEDGYRSSLGDLARIDEDLPQQFSKVIVCRMSAEDDAQVLEFVDMENNVILQLGTSNMSDYYPSFVCTYTAPKI